MIEYKQKTNKPHTKKLNSKKYMVKVNPAGIREINIKAKIKI